MAVTLRDYQGVALSKMKNGCILNGGVGSGKSRTSLAYYFNKYGGKVYIEKAYTSNSIRYLDYDNNLPVLRPAYAGMTNPPDLYIITTAKKRDDAEWEEEMCDFRLSPTIYNHKVVIDSWNNIQKYVGVTNSFFIFDEQKVIGYGAWTHAFLKIAKSNQWILLSATPGDRWVDYIPVFIANGFVKNKTAFEREHVIYDPYVRTYPKVKDYRNKGQLLKYRRAILVKMDFDRATVQHHEHIICDYDSHAYNVVKSKKFDIFSNTPIENATQYCLCLRRIVNSSPDRLNHVLELLGTHPKAIIFYNYDYELELLRQLLSSYPYAEWNGHRHDPIPEGNKWVYLVQYTGAEGWNCTTTDTVIFYSQNYSYRIMEQASGRIDRMNTPFTDLYYYHLRSDCSIENSIRKSLRCKQKFNETEFAPAFKKEVKNETKDM